MSFQIVRIDPTYCPVRDGVIGSEATRLPMTYAIEALAHKLAGRMQDENYEGCGEASFQVVRTGESPYNWHLAKAEARNAEFDDMPF